MLKIRIDDAEGNALSLDEIKYVFETLCLTMGAPWHFVNNDFSDPVDIAYGSQENHQARLWIKANLANELANSTEPRVILKDGITFLEFSKKTASDIEVNTTNNHCRVRNDIIYSIFYLITGKDEEHLDRNKLDQHDIFQSILHKNNLLHTPVFNQYVGLLEKLFAGRHEFIPKWKGGKKAALALSHDTDYPEMIKSIEILRYILKYRFKIKFGTIVDIISGKNHFWQFDNFIKLEQSYGAKSAFYFCPFKGSLYRYFFIAPDPFYDTGRANFKKVFKDLEKNGFEVGLHASYFAFKSLNSFQQEKDKLQQDAGFEIAGNRHHYWHMNPEDPSETAWIHQKSGLFYDSSFSFEKHSGFRRSICTPFNVWHKSRAEPLSILQLPPTLMDDHLFGHAPNHTFTSYQEHIDALVDSVATHEGVFVADFHARVLNSTFFPKWGDAYRYLLEAIARRGDFYMDSPINICKYWQERITLIKNKAKDEVYSTYQLQ